MSKVERYVRFERNGARGYGRLDGDRVAPIEGDLFGSREPSGESFSLSEARLLYPVEPRKILCVGLNYASHLGDRPQPEQPEMFYKPLTALQHPEGEIVLPPDAKDVHPEAELVVVIGRRASKVSLAEAEQAIFGYSCGNDVSDRNWQKGSQGDKADKQWWRAKGSDTFGPLGPCVAVGLDPSSSRIECRVNGEVRQSQTCGDLIFPPAEIVAFVSRYVTLEPGDLIYTGTPGKTRAIAPGDVVEVEIEGIGVLRNPVSG
jgi:2-keto-4-pentenoate hydratase/2-oxohepta-3-ene-1,7-dioic acid hydratase in catechol pathway